MKLILHVVEDGKSNMKNNYNTTLRLCSSLQLATRCSSQRSATYHVASLVQHVLYSRASRRLKEGVVTWSYTRALVQMWATDMYACALFCRICVARQLVRKVRIYSFYL